MRIACVGYRDWALNIYYEIEKITEHTVIIYRGKEEYSPQEIKIFSPDLILFYGWSWTIDEEIVESFNCIMLHPSALPKFRGGSPIQNQIIRGVRNSKLTLFLMKREMDSGDILEQGPLDLSGSIPEIFKRIELEGLRLTLKILKNGLIPVAQDESKATYFKRRTPEESEITIDELLQSDSHYLYNKVRMLGDPYPNAFIRTSDGKKLLIKHVEISD